MTPILRAFGFAAALAVLFLATGCPVPLGIADGCSRDEQCDDGFFCNGAESCLLVFCWPGTPPCPLSEGCDLCDEDADACHSACTDDADCDDGLFCSGRETCDSCLCVAGPPVSCPPGHACDEATGSCAEPGCDSDVQCDDGKFCNGVETCENGACVPGDPAPCGTYEGCDQCVEEPGGFSCNDPCTEDADCGGTEGCVVNWCDCGFCRWVLQECPDGLTCDAHTGLCVTSGTEP